MLAQVARLRVTLCYAVIVAVITSVMVRMDTDMHDALIRAASTNLHNLSHGRVGTLLGSAFVVDAGPIYLWLPGLVCLLAAVELLWGSTRLLLAFAVGHIGATLLVAGGLAAAVHLGWMSRAVARAPDVGMSYGAMAALGTMTAALPRRWRLVWLGWWVAAAAAVVAGAGDFTDVGHMVALLLGMTLSWRFGVPARWTVTSAVLAVLGASFGYLMLADGVVPLILGCLVAGIAFHAEKLEKSPRGVQFRRGSQRNSSAEASIQSDSHASGGSSSSSPGISQS